MPKIRFFLSFFLCKILFSCNYCILLLCIPSGLRTRCKKSIYLICNYQQRMTSRNYCTLFMEKLLPFLGWSVYLLFLFRFSFNASCTVCISFFVSPFCLCTCLYICPCLYICLCLSICACISISVCVSTVSLPVSFYLCLYLYICLCLYLCLCLCNCLSLLILPVSLYLCLYLYICLCLYLCVCPIFVCVSISIVACCLCLVFVINLSVPLFPSLLCLSLCFFLDFVSSPL